MELYAHLTFNGNCRQAMTFYQDCLGGRLHFQTVGDFPAATKLIKRVKRCIVLAALSKNGMVLLGSDLTADSWLIRGNAITLTLRCKSKQEMKAICDKLADGGSIHDSLKLNYWGIWSVNLKDKFGHHWLLTTTNRGRKVK